MANQSLYTVDGGKTWQEFKGDLRVAYKGDYDNAEDVNADVVVTITHEGVALAVYDGVDRRAVMSCFRR